MAKILTFPCPHCGNHIIPPTTPKAAKVPLAPIDTSAMSDAQLFAHYKKTALVEDLRFFLTASMSATLRAEAESLTKPTKPQMAALYQSWRIERSIAARLDGPAIGTETWFDAQGIPRSLAARELAEEAA